MSHVVDGHTKLGEDCMVYPYVTLGIASQDLKHELNSVTTPRSGDRNMIREFVSVHSGTEPESTTKIGNDCALLAHSHVAHNCTVGNHVVMSHSATLAGMYWWGITRISADYPRFHQFCHVGEAAMVAGMARVVQDVLPFTIAEGFPAHMRVINKVGMERTGYAGDDIKAVRKAFRILFARELRLEQAIEEVMAEFGDSPHVQKMLAAINDSQRGLARPESATAEMNVGG